MLLAVLVILAENKVEAVGDPEITIELSQSKQGAYVAPGQDGIVTFTGTVYAEIPWAPNVQYLVVNLNAKCSDFPVSVPPALTFSKAQKQQSFQLSIQVPIGTSSMESYTLYVNGTWSYSPGVASGECDGATAVVFVKQYYDLDLGSDDPIVDCERPGDAVFVLQVTNTGNGLDEIGLELDDRDELADASVNVFLNDDSIRLDLGETKDVKIRVEVEDPARMGTFEVDVSAYSKIANDIGHPSEQDTFTFYLEVV
ncbi:MAG: choice-of-anchor T family protein, partial [Candidatus Thermoplasmatota archaeon]|nr:choice-of-anchor T family protein [Candidatus Thermoplasmatota archaeon]